ncbi:PilN domain-containing protein [Piscinibacter sp. XHJ-5]|uniref:PilN domain-containing protein n=1 Tax=Piscinibacter sp. XHJ-5 TaxID=3037797 RepID=UPI002452C84B|nr:PilN domain-containing protein [Piscinibacter sp. XHJ-5]
MILINLLPHREERRKRRKAAYFAGLGLAAVAGLAIVGAWYLVLQQMTAAQQERNAFLNGEIKKLEVQIKDIATLRAEIESLKARQKAVEDLQIDRNVPVHILNELVKQTPEGIYFTSVRQDAQNLNVSGVAQTNERVSEFLRNTANNSEWLVKPELVEIKAATVQTASREQKRLFDFSVRLAVKRPQDKNAAEAAAAGRPASAPAAGAAASATVAKKA